MAPISLLLCKYIPVLREVCLWKPRTHLPDTNCPFTPNSIILHNPGQALPDPTAHTEFPLSQPQQQLVQSFLMSGHSIPLRQTSEQPSSGKLALRGLPLHHSQSEIWLELPLDLQAVMKKGRDRIKCGCLNFLCSLRVSCTALLQIISSILWKSGF